VAEVSFPDGGYVIHGYHSRYNLSRGALIPVVILSFLAGITDGTGIVGITEDLASPFAM
jgi:hypothetical protein